MRILADLHISPRTVNFLRQLGHDVVRVSEIMPATSSDAAIVDRASSENRIILTQDLDFSDIIALANRTSPSLTYALNGQYKRFQSWVGADDAAKPSVTFEVLVDGQKRWESGLMTVSTPVKRVDLDLAGARTLELVVGDGGNNYMADHADWADARLLR